MNRHTNEWTLLYRDSVAMLWGRSAKYDDPASGNYIPQAQRRITDTAQTGTVTWPAAPVHGRGSQLAQLSGSR